MFDRALNTPLSKLYLGPVIHLEWSVFAKIVSSSNKWIVIWDKLPKHISENFEIDRVKRGQLQNFQKSRGWFIPEISQTKRGYWFITTTLYLVKFNNRNTRKRCEICSKLTIKTPERRHWRRAGVFINFQHILHLSLLVFLLLTLNK